MTYQPVIIRQQRSIIIINKHIDFILLSYEPILNPFGHWFNASYSQTKGLSQTIRYVTICPNIGVWTTVHPLSNSITSNHFIFFQSLIL